MADKKTLARKELARRELERREKESNASDIGANIGSAAGPLGRIVGRRIGEKVGGPSELGRPEESTLLGLLNTATLGAPQAIAELSGGKLPKPQTGAEKVGSFTGNVGGAFLPGGAIAKGVKGTIKGGGALAKAARGATTGTVLGAVLPPETSFTDLKERGKQAVMGFVAGLGASVVGSLIGKAKVGLSTKKQAQVANKLRKDFFDVHTDAIDKFGGRLKGLVDKNPKAKGVTITEIIDDFKSPEGGFSEQAKNILKRVPGFKKLLKNPELADNMTAGEAQNLINAINDKIPANIRFKNFEILDTVNKIKAAQLDAFPEMSAIRAEYAEVIRPFNQVKSQFKFNRLLKAVENNFGGAEGTEAVKQLLPKATVKEMGGLRKTIKTVNAFKKITDPTTILKALITGATVGGIIKATGARDDSQ